MNQYYTPLSNQWISLVPITLEHIQAMRSLSADSGIWKWYTEDLTDPDDLERWMLNRLHSSSKGDQMTYTVTLNESGKVIGSTSYGHIDWEEKGIEIGWTWLGKAHIGSGINKQMKFLMLQHAFETMQMERVELRTDEENIRSRRAMEKIGAQYDGVLRNHRKTQGGKRRNTVIYSIIQPEWKPIRETIFNEF